MKKLFALLIVCMCQVAVAYDSSCCMPQSCCYNPCDNWSDSCCGCGCRPGLYVGAHVGYAWIQTPDDGKFELDDCPVVVNGNGSCNHHFCDTCGDRGSFAWGVFGGYNMCMCCENLYVGIEGGYHHNGCSKLRFKEHFDDVNVEDLRHNCELRSHDWNISATVDYVVCDCFDIFLKVGGARVCEKFKEHNKCKDSCNCNGSSCTTSSSLRFCNNCANEWAPVVDIGAGYCFWNCLKATLSYRGVFCDDHNHCRDAFKIEEDCNGNNRLKLKNCATVHAIYAGAVYTF